ncbi:MAG: hybrid sensor histidine kinase/response regulator [Deltaproteobacteria bacterium HGW-Deltaproteobacteria-4]|nr:MAG: hybrid sensor histidine kinase/response regulator [Deltaproteobacteria bacterium HGW-Deltaproteobacteria-4]
MKTRKYIDLFVKEAKEHLAALRNGLLILKDEGFSAARIHDLLRSAHTIKGSAMMLELDDIGRISHVMEDLFGEIEQGKRPLTPTLIDLLAYATEALDTLTKYALSGESVDLSLDALVAALRSGAALTTADITPLVSAAPPVEALPLAMLTVRADVEQLDQIINHLGEVAITRHAFEERGRELRGLTRELEQFVRQLKRAENVRSLRDIQGRLATLTTALDGDLGNLSYLTQELHHSAMELRMLPLSTITDDLGHMARGLAREQGKELNLSISGAQVELDRMMLEILKPVLLHMLRNAVDHGLESADERLLAGKNPTGKVDLVARYESGYVCLTLSDDGRGIDPVQVRSKAVERGLLSAEQAAQTSDEEAAYLILRPGFTTRDYITDISGRGVGMDVVKNSLDKVKGDIIISSVHGRGTQMRLQLPLTMAMISGLLFDCAGTTLAVPLHYVSEILRIDAADVISEGGREMVRVHGRSIPIISLAEVLGLADDKPDSGEKQTVLVISSRERQLACLVSHSYGVKEMIVKGMGKQLKRVEFFSGVTIMGDGSPVLILAAPDLFNSGRSQGSTTLRQAHEEGRRRAAKGRILVVDDSITTRTMEKNILEAHGYRVTVACSGPDALQRLTEGDYDLIVSDVEMPGMTGFELTAAVRRNDRTKGTPVIIVSSLATDEDKRLGLKAGAQAYIVKGNFDQGSLLETVETLIG